LRKAFIRTFNEIAYPLLHHSNLPEMKWHDVDSMEARETIIKRFSKQARKNKISFDHLLNDDEEFKPFNMNELAFEILY
jgi:hypothetical protein